MAPRAIMNSLKLRTKRFLKKERNALSCQESVRWSVSKRDKKGATLLFTAGSLQPEGQFANFRDALEQLVSFNTRCHVLALVVTF